MFERQNLFIFTRLVHKSENWISWFSTLKKVYIHLPCTINRGGASILSPGNLKHEYQKKSMPNIKHWKKNQRQVYACIKLSPWNPEWYKKFCSQRVKWVDHQSAYSLCMKRMELIPHNTTLDCNKMQHTGELENSQCPVYSIQLQMKRSFSCQSTQ